MNPKLILNIDLDDTVAHLHKTIKGLKPDIEWTNTGFFEFCTKNRNIFDQLEPIEGAIESIKRLSEMYEIEFVSAPMWKIHESYTDKRLWVGRYFGEDWAEDRLTLTTKKDRLQADYLIDDYPDYARRLDNFKGEHIHIFTDPKFDSWKSVEQYLTNRVTSW